MRWGSLCLRATRRSSGHIHRAVHILMRVRAANKAYFIRLAKSRCGMPARRAPNRLACVALHSVTVAIGLCSVRLPRMGATQYSRWTELHSLGATLLLAPAYVRLPLRLSHLLRPRLTYSPEWYARQFSAGKRGFDSQGCHSARSRPAMATGRPLMILLAR